MLYVGIDPGEHTGLAIWDTEKAAFTMITTVALHQALEWVKAWHEKKYPICVVFEDARQRRWFQKETSNSEYRGKLMGAGAAKRDAAIWEEFCRDNGIPYQAVPPRAGATKWNKEYWERMTGWTKRTSEHARDAALLVFKRQ